MLLVVVVSHLRYRQLCQGQRFEVLYEIRSHNKLALWSIRTTLLIIASFSGGTSSQRLKASIIWPRISFPGLEEMYAKGSVTAYGKNWSIRYSLHISIHTVSFFSGHRWTSLNFWSIFEYKPRPEFDDLLLELVSLNMLNEWYKKKEICVMGVNEEGVWKRKHSDWNGELQDRQYPISCQLRVRASKCRPINAELYHVSQCEANLVKISSLAVISNRKLWRKSSESKQSWQTSPKPHL